MNTFSLIFVAALVAATTVELWLARRQLRHVAAHRGNVPEPFAPSVTLDEHRRAADYSRSGTHLEVAGVIHHAVLLLAWTLGGGIALVDAYGRSLGLGPVATGTLVILTVVFVNSVLTLPLSLYRTFVIEERFGFNHTRPLLYMTDLLKATLLSLLFGVPLVAAALLIMAPGGSTTGLQANPWWWLYAWLLWLAFSLVMLWVYPRFIAPFFNRFSPLEDAALRQRIQALLARTGFSGSDVFVMDGSRRSAHGNAYFTGLGSNKRIVFFDTLLDSLSPEEIEAVLAHELGHFRLRHIHKRIVSSALFMLGGLLILNALLGEPWFYAGLGVAEPSNHTALVLFAFVTPVFGFFLSPLSMYFSRRHEFEADAFAARQADPDDLISALVKLYRENASTLTPDPLYSAFHYSHPEAAARIARLAAATKT